MNIDEFLKDQLNERRSKYNAVGQASRPSIDEPESLGDLARKIRVILGEKFSGKIETADDLRKMISIIKKNEGAFKSVFWGNKSPKAWAKEIGGAMKEFSDRQIDGILAAAERSGFSKDKERKIFDFASAIENRFFEAEVGDIGALFHGSAKKKPYEEEGEKFRGDRDGSAARFKRRFSNMIPMRAEKDGKSYLGVIRPAGPDGLSGIITWQANAMVDEDEEGETKLPSTIPLLKKSEGSQSLGVHATKNIKAAQESGKLDWDDSEAAMAKMGHIVLDLMLNSGRKFHGADITNRKALEADLQQTEIPPWVFMDPMLWKEVGKFV